MADWDHAQQILTNIATCFIEFINVPLNNLEEIDNFVLTFSPPNKHAYQFPDWHIIVYLPPYEIDAPQIVRFCHLQLAAGA